MQPPMVTLTLLHPSLTSAVKESLQPHPLGRKQQEHPLSTRWCSCLRHDINLVRHLWMEAVSHVNFLYCKCSFTYCSKCTGRLIFILSLFYAFPFEKWKEKIESFYKLCTSKMKKFDFLRSLTESPWHSFCGIKVSGVESFLLKPYKIFFF